MPADAWWTWMWQSSVALTLAWLLVLGLRPLARRLAGPVLMHALWALLPLFVLATLAAQCWPGWAPRWASAVAPDIVVQFETPVATTAVHVAKGFAWTALLMVLWLGGAALVLLAAGYRHRQLARSLRRVDGHWTSVLESGPALVGLWRTRVVLPADFATRFDAAERELVIAHEAMHGRRRDTWWQGLALLLRAVYWFHPVLFPALRRHRMDQELACDAAVLRGRPEVARRYAGALLKSGSVNPWLPLGCHWQSRHPLLERIAMLNPQRLPLLSTHTALALGAALLVGASWTCFAVQSGAAAAPATVAHDDRTRLLYQARLFVDGQQVSAPQLVAKSGRLASIRQDDGSADNDWTIDLQGQPGPESSFAVQIGLQHGGHGAPTLQGVSGGASLLTEDRRDHRTIAAIRTRGPATLDYAAGNHRLRLELDVQILPPGVDPDGPIPTKRVPPTYPAAAIRDRVEGRVVTEVDIDATGKATAARIVSAEPPGVFDQQALEMAMKWTFNPPRDDRGQPRASTVKVPLNFKMDPPQDCADPLAPVPSAPGSAAPAPCGA